MFFVSKNSKWEYIKSNKKQPTIDNAIIELRSKWHLHDLLKGKIKIVMTGSSNVSASEVMGTEILKEMARELAKRIKSSTTFDWNIRKMVRSKIRFEIKILPNKYN